MFKITNGQAAMFNSPVINKLFDESDRTFPTDDAFRLADIIQQIHAKNKIYQEQARKIIDNFGGSVDDKGRVSYNEKKDALAAQMELEKLNMVEIELTGSLLKVTPEWPNFNLNEALILKPLLSMNGKSKE